ncbi:hypothetical protein AAFC00_001009 [Neodothiora populina]|uniref:Amidase domain-containing protein n=1 Tax=Neodothiora populina TaxID=2781224 RepID=A0ABR3PMG6_9PEZI
MFSSLPFLKKQSPVVDAEEREESFVVIDEKQPESQDDVPEVFRMPTCDDHDLYEISVDELQHLFSSSSLTAVEYVRFCLERIRRVNPYLECVIETNPDALGIAKQLDDERKEGKVRGPLHGIPVIVKDNMATKDKMQTTAGSWALLGSIVPKDAHIVHLLRRAGAIVLAKSNLDEWAGMRSSVYSNGYSARGGQCRNPYMLSRSAMGSSSGSAVSVSANIVPLAFGTETDTSIIWPGMVCGVVAIKPTVGLTSRGGVIPISETQDSVGPYGRTVADAARALDVIAGADPDDEFSTGPERRQEKSYFECLTDRSALKGARFGLPMKRFWELVPAPQKKIAEKVLELIKEAGAEIIPVEMPCAEERIHKDGRWDWEHYGHSIPSRAEITVSKVETYALTNQYLSRLTTISNDPFPIQTLEDIVDFNDDNPGTEGGIAGTHPAFPDGQKLFRECVATQGVKDETYHAALAYIRRQTRERGIDYALTHYPSSFSSSSSLSNEEENSEQKSLDALLFCDVLAPGQNIAAQAAYPILTLPIGLDCDGVPVSLSFQHTAWREGEIVRWASAVEDLLVAVMSSSSSSSSSSSVVVGSKWEMGGEGERERKRKERVGRVTPTYKDFMAKNVPVDEPYRSG